jgi:predicted protein tyrosine phosphatase
MFQPWIQNVSLDDIQKGCHHDAGDNSMLIQVVDPDMDFPVPKMQFKKIIQVKFLDVENDSQSGLVFLDAIDQAQAKILVDALRFALANHMNVVVHCVAGICRSGAIVDVGVQMGFMDTGVFRLPNVMVKKMMMDLVADNA